MKILEASFLVTDPVNGTLIVEFAYQPSPIVRVWRRADFGTGKKPLLEEANAARIYKPCAKHAEQLVELAFRNPPADWSGEQEIQLLKPKGRSKVKMLGGPTA